MSVFTKESLENLRQRIDLVDLLAPYVDLKKAGAAYKALCPFHDEKSPSFTIQKGDSHYHCFGCGAHGDAIAFLMNHQKLSFSESVQMLAEKFQVPLEKVERGDDQPEVSKSALKELLGHASRFFHFFLLHTPEGHQVLQYLYARGLDLAFIRQFQIGLAPKQAGLLRRFLYSKQFNDDLLIQAGLLRESSGGGKHEFFSERITFPILDHAGSVIGFSARKYKEETYGGKYVNTPETPLFKKSRVLFGISYCRRRIAKERRAIIVEGQIDALRLIQEGFNFTVAGQGTAFGEAHAKELINLGVNRIYLSLDADGAGQEAAYKIGHLFQKEGVEVKVVKLPVGEDPDSFLRKNSPEAYLKLLEVSIDYLSFLVAFQSAKANPATPSGKNELVRLIVQQVREWKHPLLVHETLKKLAHTLQVPEEMVGVGEQHVPNLYIKKASSIDPMAIDPDRVREGDLLRWILFGGKHQGPFLKWARVNLQEDDFRVPICRSLYRLLLKKTEAGEPLHLLAITLELEEGAQQFLHELQQKKVNSDKAEEQFQETLQKLLDRSWMEKREAVRRKIQSGECEEAELDLLVKEFDTLKEILRPSLAHCSEFPLYI